MKVWKIASRWSDDGNRNSVLEIFREKKIAFVYNKNIRTAEVELGDLLAVSDGRQIVCIGKALSKAKPIEEFNIPELNVYDDDGLTVGFKIDMMDLSEKEIIEYEHIGRFHELHQEIKTRVMRIWEKRERRFSIDAKTCTLLFNRHNTNNTVLGSRTKFIVPIYQRPFSWDYAQLNKFISDIFLSYWGPDYKIIEEPMFIGTMQLSEKKFYSAQNFDHEQEVIDGQQRLSTFLVLLKVLKTQYPDCLVLSSISFDWLETKVNNGTQQEYLNFFVGNTLQEEPVSPNIYTKNSCIIKELVEEQIYDDNGVFMEFDIDRFSKHILSNIYFVIIETQAGLSKTIQIFNAINTTGLDLNGGDVFKIRMYEYLRDKKGQNETAFNDISGLYQKIDDFNSQRGEIATDMRAILSIYQQILIAKYDLPSALYELSSDTFFDRLFDTILNYNQWEYFKNNVSNLEITVLDLNRIIEVRSYWEFLSYPTAEDACAVNFIGWSRYSRYWMLYFLFLFRFKDENDCDKNLFRFIRQLSKLFVLYSVIFLKAIGDIHRFVHHLTKSILSDSPEKIIEMINTKISDNTQYGASTRQSLNNELDSDIVCNTRVKNIVCRLSAFLEENFLSQDDNEIEQIRRKLFEADIDIEHIQAYHDSDGNKRQDIIDKWDTNLNSVGNLMILEQSINRSISNSPYKLKILRYPGSAYEIVLKQVIDFKGWDLADCIKRKEREKEKILEYIFESV